jgi:cell wall-associated NlpC family hydrolase
MKNLLLISSVLLISGCIQKNKINQYPNNYSYHSYNSNFINNQIERTAKSHLGKKYVWGANGPYTFDCSGFTKAVFAQYNINIPRVSQNQAQKGKIIPWNYLKKGDLIFFDSKKSSRVSHVGIYLGSGKFIHASSAKHCVVISNLTSNYYTKHFKWGRRVTEINRYTSR